MTREQIGYLVTCALLFAVGAAIFAVGVALSRVSREDASWPGYPIGLGLLCMTLAPIMLIGFPDGGAS